MGPLHARQISFDRTQGSQGWVYKANAPIVIVPMFFLMDIYTTSCAGMYSIPGSKMMVWMIIEVERERAAGMRKNADSEIR